MKAFLAGFCISMVLPGIVGFYVLAKSAFRCGFSVSDVGD